MDPLADPIPGAPPTTPAEPEKVIEWYIAHVDASDVALESHVTIPWKSIFTTGAIVASAAFAGVVAAGWFLGRESTNDWAAMASWGVKRQPLIQTLGKKHQDYETQRFKELVGAKVDQDKTERLWFDGANPQPVNDAWKSRVTEVSTDMHIEVPVEPEPEPEPEPATLAADTNVAEDQRVDPGAPRIQVLDDEEADIDVSQAEVDKMKTEVLQLRRQNRMAEALELVEPLFYRIKDYSDSHRLEVRLPILDQTGICADACGEYELAREAFRKYVNALQSEVPIGTDAKVDRMYFSAYLKLGAACWNLKKLEEGKGYVNDAIEGLTAQGTPTGEDSLLLGLLLLQKARLCESALEDVPHGELPEVFEEGIEACVQAGQLFVPPLIPNNHPFFYRPKRYQFSLLITVGKMAEACEVQRTVLEAMEDKNGFPYANEVQSYSEILYDFGKVEEAEKQLLVAIEIIEGLTDTNYPKERILLNLKSEYIHKFLFRSGRIEEAQAAWNAWREEWLEMGLQMVRTENMELRVREVDVSTTSVSLEVQLKRTIEHRQPRLSEGTELRMRIVSWDGSERITATNGSEVLRHTVTQAQRESDDRAARRHRFTFSHLNLDPSSTYVAVIEAFASQDESIAYSKLRQMLVIAVDNNQSPAEEPQIAAVEDEDEANDDRAEQQHVDRTPEMDDDSRALLMQASETLKAAQEFEQRGQLSAAMGLLRPAYEKLKDATDPQLVQISFALMGKIGMIAEQTGEFPLAYEMLSRYVKELQSMAPPGTDAQLDSTYASLYLKLANTCCKLKKRDECSSYVENGLRVIPTPDSTEGKQFQGLFWLQKADLCESILEEVPHGDLPEVLADGLNACLTAEKFLSDVVPAKNPFYYRPRMARVSLLITVGKMGEACEVQQGLIDLQREKNVDPRYIGWAMTDFYEILYDWGRVEAAEKLLLEVIDGAPKDLALKNAYIHKFLFPSGRTEEAQALWEELRDQLLEAKSKSENNELRVREVDVSATSVSLEVQLKRTIEHRQPRLSEGTELRMRIVSWDGSERITATNGSDLWRHTVTQAQRESDDRAARRHRFTVDNLQLFAGQPLVVIIEAFRSADDDDVDSEPYMTLRQPIVLATQDSEAQ